MWIFHVTMNILMVCFAIKMKHNFITKHKVWMKLLSTISFIKWEMFICFSLAQCLNSCSLYGFTLRIITEYAKQLSKEWPVYNYVMQ